MKRFLMPATALFMKKAALTLLACTVLMVLIAADALAQGTTPINFAPGGFTTTTVCPSSSITSGCQAATNGNTEVTGGGALRLTPNAIDQVGSAWFVTPLPVSTGFQ